MAQKTVIKLSSMAPDMQEFALTCAQDAILSKNTEQVTEPLSRGLQKLLASMHDADARQDWAPQGASCYYYFTISLCSRNSSKSELESDYCSWLGLGRRVNSTVVSSPHGRSVRALITGDCRCDSAKLRQQISSNVCSAL